MDTLSVVARIVLIAVFTLSGVTKLLDNSGTRKALGDFKLHKALVAPLSFVLPVAEISTAIAFLFVATVTWASVASIFLLMLFIAGISINLLQGNKPDCHCFGQLYSKPISWKTLVRNMLLLVCSLFLFYESQRQPVGSLFVWVYNLSTLELLNTVVIILNSIVLVSGSWLFIMLWQQQGRLLVRLETVEQVNTTEKSQSFDSKNSSLPLGLNIGERAPNFDLPNIAGDRTTLSDFLKEQIPLVLLFTDPGCGPCTALLPAINNWQSKFRSSIRIVLISTGPEEDNQNKALEHNLTDVLIQKKREVALMYRAHGTPAALLVDENGFIQSGVAYGSESIEEIMKSIQTKVAFTEDVA